MKKFIFTLLVLSYAVSAQAGMLCPIVGMAKSTAALVTVTDNFNRSNGGLGTNWATITGLSAPAIDTNAVTASANAGAYWSANSFAPNQYATAKIQGYNNPAFVGVIVRQSSTQNTAYSLQLETTYDEGLGFNILRGNLVKTVDGSPTTIYSDILYIEDMASPFYIKLEVAGTSLTVYSKYNVGDSWTSAGSVTDSSISTGSPGFYVRDSNYIDDFGAGDL
jgi:hypothetical protein